MKYLRAARRILCIFILTAVVALVLPGAGMAALATSVFSAPKYPPEGFSEIVEPNVLLLIDTSGSMSFFMHNDDKTWGDGSKPYSNKPSSIQKYYGKDRNPGKDTANTNNIVSKENLNYHPNLEFIPEDEISPSDDSYRTYLAYDELERKWQRLQSRSGLPSLSSLYRYQVVTTGGITRVVIQNRPNSFSTSWSNLSAFDSYLSGRFDSNHRYSLTDGIEKLFDRYAYKYPNDSRMYALKNVLYRILGEPTLVEGLRLGLASYYQTTHSGTTNSDWYKWNPASNGTAQKITSKNGKDNRAVLREPFKSTSREPGHLETIRQWFDGIETSGNKEFRADGGTPLADSIYNTKGNSAYHYIKDAIQYWCQDNWLVVFTDGADDAISSQPNKAPNAVKSLYNASFTLNGQKTRPVKTLVVGLVDDAATSNEAFVNSLNAMAAEGKTGSGAFFAKDMDSLFLAFKTIFKTIQEVSATGSAPLVNPPSKTGEGGGVFSTAFRPSSVRQWTGFLTSYVLKDGDVEEEIKWEAGSLLSEREYTDRTILTALWEGSAETLSGTNLHRFSAGNAAALRPLLRGSNSAVTNDQLDQFINWTMGSDEWKESESGEKWKLGDPYHVGLTEVGEPRSALRDPAYRTFAADHAARGAMVYMHANDGMVHGFNGANGKEEWAFIPPSVLNYPRLLGTKLYENGTFIDHAASIPKYLLDGPLIAEDVLIDGVYKTVLLGALGRAGAGLYAMDITDPGRPQFLWAMDNNVYSEPGILRTEDKTFLKWTAAGQGSSLARTESTNSMDGAIPGRLRLTVSTPFLGAVDLAESPGVSPETKWIALLGAGARQAPLLEEEDDGGRAVYALDIKNGDLVRQITHDKLGAVVAPISVEAGVRPMRIKKYYLGDDLGSVFEGDLTSSAKAEWKLGQVFDSTISPPAGGIFSIPYALEIGTIKSRKWLFWGTGDPDWLFDKRDGACYIFGMNRSLAGGNPFTFEDLPVLIEGTDGLGDTIAQSPKGWRMALPGEKEMISTPPVLYGGYIFFGAYIPRGDDPCAVGDSNFYIMKGDTGEGGFMIFDANDNITSRKKSVHLEATRISGITISDGKLYVGVTGFSKASNPKEVFKDYTNEGAMKLSGNLLVIDIPDYIQEEKYAGSSMKTEPAYWRHWRP